ncbi:phosphatases II [Dichomitus squalens]|uniref:protein-tyrosine-phosphatase n=1 Tax=Dichomitus squalens TaxID=114155 RepID=A0A4Q9N4H5_9APHY|nr:phosphatases II [Dichomitus squalens]
MILHMPQLSLCTSIAQLPRSALYGDASSPAPSPLQPEPPAQITENVFLGDLSAAESPEILTALGITHVLSVMSGHVALPSHSELPHLPPYQPLQRMQVQVQDHPFVELASHLPRTTAWIANALRDPHARVLVHCVQGISRSATVAAAYLMATRGLSPGAAVARVKELRQCANPNEGFRGQLLEYEQCLLKNRAREHYSHAHSYRQVRGELR